MPKFQGVNISHRAKYAILDESRKIAHGPFDTLEDAEVFIYKNKMWPKPRIVAPITDYADSAGNIHGFPWEWAVALRDAE